MKKIVFQADAKLHAFNILTTRWNSFFICAVALHHRVQLYNDTGYMYLLNEPIYHIYQVFIYHMYQYLN